MNKETQIKVLRQAKITMLADKSKRGCCFHITEALEEVIGYETHYFMLSKFIPLFTREKAFEFAIKGKFKQPNNNSCYWWVSDNCTVRIKFLNSIIHELKAL